MDQLCIILLPLIKVLIALHEQDLYWFSISIHDTM